MGDKKEKDASEDPRLEWIFNYLTKTLKLRQEKWNKMITTDEYIVSGIYPSGFVLSLTPPS